MIVSFFLSAYYLTHLTLIKPAPHPIFLASLVVTGSDRNLKSQSESICVGSLRLVNRLISLLESELSGDNAKQHAGYMTQFMRTPGSSGIRSAIQYAEEHFRKQGIDRVYRIEYPVKNGWDISDAEVRIVSPVDENVVTYSEAPTCIQWWSVSTPHEGIVAELVDVGSGLHDEDYQGKQILRKIVLAAGDGHAEGNDHAYRLAIEKYGATGLLTDSLLYPQPPFRTRVRMPDAVQLLRTPRLGKGWAFSISYTKAQRLRELLKTGPVRLKVKINAQNFEGIGHTLVVEIKGRDIPDEEVWFVAHCSGTKPGANCAGGAGLWIEQAKLIAHLFREQKIAGPKRTIRFIMGAEGGGLEGYLESQKRQLPKVHAAFVYCSPGNDQDKCKSSLILFKSPESIPSFLNDLCVSTIKKVSGDALPPFKDISRDIEMIRFNAAPYTPWSDNSRLMRLKIPCPLFMSWPDIFFHTQYLTDDKLDSDVLKRCGIVTSYVAITVANAGVAEARQILDEVECVNRIKITETAVKARQELIDLHLNESTREWAKERLAHREMELDYLLENGLKSIRTIEDLVRTSDEDGEAAKYREEAENSKKRIQELVRFEKEKIRKASSECRGVAK